MPRDRSRADAALGWDHRDDAALTQGKPDAAAAVGLVADHLGGSQAPPADAPDRAAADQGAHLPGVVNLTTGHREDNRLAVALAAQVDREAATRAAQRLVLGTRFTACPRRHAGERARPCCPGSATPSRPAPGHRPGPATPPARAAIRQTGASGRTGSTPSRPDH